ncbi:Tetratricopeptide repeat-containing protein [Hyunsoonleella jejuensis]|uniref:Tetratricopeptide repeat-containing protein n=1 Tax=Hyunsoonleella jejuensis TaxID=419940 RepID=A0A1H9KXV5_9FLAO|nr:thioredoxin family protein [Hyunsoonleella jejuensis]SER04012.1 Tetratricopeptide repeat-containing protein [Hyunsoonleella jejuensis]
MKSILFLLVFSVVLTSKAQSINQEITIEGESPFLLGKIDKKGLTSVSYKSWFYQNFNNYALDKATLESIGERLNDYTITLFMGTWCGDSKREVPRFYKILEACNFPKERLSVIAVSGKPYMYKKSPNHEEAGLNIHRVPTFIFYKNGQEINRIVEHPVATLEKDILNIITSNDYESNYQIVTKINTILKYEGVNGFRKKQKKLVKNFKGKVSTMFELNTYGKVLYTENRKQEAIEVFKLNNMLFPDNPRSYMSLANTLGANKKKEEAIMILEKALERFPDNKDLAKNLDIIKSN